MPVDGKTTVGLISLGCAKNLIDSEIMVGHLQEAGMLMTPDAELADVLIINTCSFIDNAKKESVDTILGAVDEREESGERQKIIVAGCLSQRFSNELPDLMPEVDAFIGLDLAVVDEGNGNRLTDDPRRKPDGSRNWSEVGIGDGASRRCR